MHSSRQTRRTHTTSDKDRPTQVGVLNLWSDDSCRDYLLKTSLEELTKRQRTLRAAEEVGMRYTATYTAPSVSSSHPGGSASNARLSSSKHAPTAASATAAGGADADSSSPRYGLHQSTARAMAERPLGVDPTTTAATESAPKKQSEGEEEFKTPMRLAETNRFGNTENVVKSSSGASTEEPLGGGGSGAADGASPVARALLSLSGPADAPNSDTTNAAERGDDVPEKDDDGDEEEEEAEPLLPTPIDEITTHFATMVSKGIVLERFSIKDMQFISWLLRGELRIPKKRDALVMEMRTFYYETLKKVRTTPSPPRRPDLLPGEGDKAEENKTSAADAKVATTAAAAAATTITTRATRRGEAQQAAAEDEEEQEAPTAPTTRGVKQQESKRAGAKRKNAAAADDDTAVEPTGRATRSTKKGAVDEAPPETADPDTVVAPQTNKSRKAAAKAAAEPPAPEPTTLPVKRTKKETPVVTKPSDAAAAAAGGTSPVDPGQFRSFSKADIAAYFTHYGKEEATIAAAAASATAGGGGGNSNPAIAVPTLPWLPRVSTASIVDVPSGRKREEPKRCDVVGIAWDAGASGASAALGAVELPFEQRAIEVFRAARAAQHRSAKS